MEKFEPGKAQKFYRYHIKLLKQVEIPKEMAGSKRSSVIAAETHKRGGIGDQRQIEVFGTSEAKKRIIKG